MHPEVLFCALPTNGACPCGSLLICLKRQYGPMYVLCLTLTRKENKKVKTQKCQGRATDLKTGGIDVKGLAAFLDRR